MRDRRGVVRGTRYKAPRYDPATGEPWRPGSNFEPDNAKKLMQICARLDISIAGFLNELVKQLEVDATTGVPVGWPHTPKLTFEEAKKAD